MVLADGKIVIANEEEHPGLCHFFVVRLCTSYMLTPRPVDLWWALRGAGPCLGIATRYKAKAFPVPVVFAGNLL
jgi:hypothetical protein